MTRIGSTLGLALTISVPTLALATRASAQSPAAPPVGVYACFGQSGPSIPMMFGVLDAKRYATYDGTTGHYRYDARTGVLTRILANIRGESSRDDPVATRARWRAFRSPHMRAPRIALASLRASFRSGTPASDFHADPDLDDAVRRQVE